MVSRPDGGWMNHRLRPSSVMRRVVEPDGSSAEYKRPFTRTELFGMPRRAPVRRTALKRRSFRRRRRAYWRRPQRAVQPYSVIRRLKVCNNLNFDNSAGAYSEIVLNLNSAYDPLGTASATDQGLGFDQYEALYNKYCVVGWKIVVEAVSMDNSTPIVVGFTPTTTNSSLTSYTRAKEMAGTVSRIVTPDIDKTGFVAKGSVKRWLMPAGGKLLTNDLMWSTVATNPSSILFGHLWVQPVDQSSDPGTVRFVYTLHQLVVFFDPKVPTRSTQ